MPWAQTLLDIDGKLLLHAQPSWHRGLFAAVDDHQRRRKPSLPVKEFWKLPSMSVV